MNHILPLLVYVGLFTCCLSQQLILTSQTDIQEVTSASSRHDLNDLTSQTDIPEVTSSRHDLTDLTSQTDIQEVTSSRHDLNDLTSQTDIQEVTSSRHDLSDITNINVQFLVFIGEQYNDCNATVSTPYIKAGQSWNDAPTINISNCDSGKFMFQIQQDNKTKELTVTVNYYTKAYSIGPPPSCDFKWKGDYQVPTAKNMELSPLPGCYYHFTDKEDYHSDFMFQMLTWQWF
ncbi:hypothetical protein ACF0H5_016109 [Mactra antiquata]